MGLPRASCPSDASGELQRVLLAILFVRFVSPTADPMHIGTGVRHENQRHRRSLVDIIRAQKRHSHQPPSWHAQSMGLCLAAKEAILVLNLLQGSHFFPHIRLPSRRLLTAVAGYPAAMCLLGVIVCLLCGISIRE